MLALEGDRISTNLFILTSTKSYAMRCWFFGMCSVLLFCVHVTAQNTVRSDSTYTLAEAIQHYLDLSRIYESSSHDSSLYFANLAFEEANKTTDEKLKTTAQLRVGVALHNLGRWPSAIKALGNALEKCLENNWPKETLLASLDLGNTYLAYGRYHEVNESADLAEENFRQALKFYTQALQQSKRVSDAQWSGRVCQNIGASYYYLGNYTMALIYYGKALDLFRKLKDHKLEADILSNMGAVYFEEGHLDSAFYYHEHSREYFSTHQIPEGLIVSNINLAEIYKAKGDLRLALSLLYQADSIAEKLNDPYLKSLIQENLHATYVDLDDHERALAHYKGYTLLKDEMINSESQERLDKLNAIYEAEKQKREITSQKLANAEKDKLLLKASQERKSLLMVSGISISLALLLTAFFVWRQRFRSVVNRKDKELMNQRINQLMKDQQIRSMETALKVKEAERKRIASDLHDKLGATLTATRMAFESAGYEPDDDRAKRGYRLIDQAIAETRNIAYDMLSGVLTKFGLEAALHDLKSTVNELGTMAMKLECHKLDVRLDAELELGIYRILQELLNNTMKHARASLFAISIIREKSELTVKTVDDGIGFNLHRYNKGMGLKNIRTRVRSLNGAYTMHSKPGQGTQTVLTFILKDEVC